MNKTLKVIGIVILVVVIIALPFVSTRNKLVTLEQNVNLAESNIDTQLQRRSDLIPNLVETVKGYAAQEKEIFTNIADARAKLSGAVTTEDKVNGDAQLTTALRGLLAISERYPELKSNQNFRDLQVALEGSENRVSIARGDYNKVTSEYNTYLKRFPNNIFGAMFNFKEKPYFKASEGATEVPKVDFKK